jgi:hypothetical protein
MSDPRWIAAIANATWTARRFTIGGSADDAGIGGLDVRRVIALNPTDWNEDLAAWYAAHYPGVEFHSASVASPADVREAMGRYL